MAAKREGDTGSIVPENRRARGTPSGAGTTPERAVGAERVVGTDRVVGADSGQGRGAAPALSVADCS
ncbi:hypothetical protein NCCP1664_06350 [Zafaria cholistanensis]|uniref:Uncharacterized protein n=1 Tax=Zafaria cholistanensis TaxID=1682741 RepID=A0A5A7NQP3_9MICC|nr:hypothetical protein NCCP1664_06350 [Zafaria cholistanensis]